jgi:hypothetical protein
VVWLEPTGLESGSPVLSLNGHVNRAAAERRTRLRRGLSHPPMDLLELVAAVLPRARRGWAADLTSRSGGIKPTWFCAAFSGGGKDHVRVSPTARSSR